MKLLFALALTAATVLPAQTIAIVNKTSSVSDATLTSVMNAVASQVHNEYKAKWGNDATFVFVGKGKTAPSSAWKCYIDDTKGDYHTVSGSQPVAYCHVKGETVDYWTNTISHEVLEMRTNPNINQVRYEQNGTAVNLEVCDACETNDQGYRISSILMSDFVYPNWFNYKATSSFDYRGLITAPFQVLPGGYLSTGREGRHGDGDDK